ncbi:PKD domain-containing protein [Streptomyces sp. NBC_00190]|uniref:PKD domain-containing protein n=1 Tax=unclassified Streptomyces TaxID=2593676 RepID=UPI002E2CAAA4|nr:PKD domain-containing protein [Streptomyces sp. NBC_00190]WSZ40162.1 PKD domain-containing protein [Streptomyces sp. NBC_00868]
MRPTRATVLLTAGLVSLLGLPATAAATENPTTLYVDHTTGSGCSDSGPGSQDTPLCTISAAAKAVQPGQTVRIVPGKPYDEAVTIDRSGQPGKPITFEGGVTGSSQFWLAAGRPLTVSGASHVVVRGLGTQAGLRVTGSTDVEVDRMNALKNPGAVTVDGGSTDVRLSRSRLDSSVRIEGAQGTVLSRNEIHGYANAAVTAYNAPGTVVTNNTVYLSCEAAVSLGEGSTASALFNNVIHTESAAGCPAPDPRYGIAVAQGAASGTRADYNLVTGPFSDARVAYKWADTPYRDQAAFHAATGHGAHDILTPSRINVGPWDGSPTVDSGDPTAPGVLPTDFLGRPVGDDPRVPNTGKDGGYVDRGSRELQDYLQSVRVELEQGWAPVGTTVKANAVPNSTWAAALSYRYDFGDGTAPVVTKATSAEHVYGAPCECTVKVTATNVAGQQVQGQQTAKVTPAAPLATAFTATPVLPSADAPREFVPPLSVEAEARTTAAPWPVQRMDVDFGDGAKESRSALEPVRHAYKQPGTYKVTVTLQDIKGATSTAERTVQVAYTPAGYVPLTPTRVLDTRTSGTPVQGGTATPVTLPIVFTGSGPNHTAGASAAVLNVTVTGATEDTHLSVWPAGQPRPVTSNVNVKAGGTSSNTVTVPIGADGKVSAQLNSGKAALIVDFVGYYQPNAGQRFTPLAPARLVDTRTTGGALGGGQTRTVKVAGVGGIPADATAVALNLTGTGATEQAHVIAYPDPDPNRRPTTSNLNVEPGKDKSNQAIVPVGPNGTITLYTNTGSTHLILDAVGYYAEDGKALFTPVVPQRLADTRTTGKLAPGATTTVAGIPANAIGAALNVTATDTTGPGFLTVHGHGAARPEASSLQTRPGDTVPNHVTTPVADGRVSISNSYGGSTHVITDLFGYFTQG